MYFILYTRWIIVHLLFITNCTSSRQSLAHLNLWHKTLTSVLEHIFCLPGYLNFLCVRTCITISFWCRVLALVRNGPLDCPILLILLFTHVASFHFNSLHFSLLLFTRFQLPQMQYIFSYDDTLSVYCVYLRFINKDITSNRNF